MAAGDIETKHGLLWVLMITSAANRRWVGDITISDLEAAGLPAASVIRSAKIATIESGDAERIGHLRRADQKKAVKILARILPLALE